MNAFKIKSVLKMKTIPVVLFLVLAFSCSKDEEDVIPQMDKSYLIFGHYFGECLGEDCIEIFKINSGHLYEDTMDQYPQFNQAYRGHFVEKSDSLYNLVSDLPNLVPDQLLQETDTVIGDPDGGDWGGLYIEISVDGQRKFWFIDKVKTSIPEYLRPFALEIENAIEKLR